jgi:multisubunit Na+/H+ antiporter MnhB subunit
MKYLLGALGGLALVFILIGAIQLMVSQGNPEGVTKGKDTIIWAIAGLVVALLSFSVLAIVQNLIS